MPVSSRGYFVMAKESTAYTARSERKTTQSSTEHNGYPYYWAYPVEEVEIDPAKEFIDFQEIRGSRQAYTTLDGPFRPTATFKGAVYPGSAVGQILYGTFGDARVIGSTSYGTPVVTDWDSDSGTVGTQLSTDNTASPETAYEMVFSDGPTLPTFTLERADAAGSGATIVQQVAGCKVESLQFTANFGEKVDMTVNFQAAKKPEVVYQSGSTTLLDPLSSSQIVYPGQEYAGTSDDQAIVPLYFNRSAIKIAGSQSGMAAYMKTLSFEINNTLERQEVLKATVGADGVTITPRTDAYAIYEGGVECTLSGTAVFESLDLYTKLMSGDTFTMELWLGSDTTADRVASVPSQDNVNHLLYFKWPKLKVSKASIPFTAGEVIESDIEFKVIYDPAATITSFGGAAVSGITGASVFAKMISRHPGRADANSVLRPSFYW